MAILAMASADLNDLSAVSPASGAVISTEQARTGSRSYKFNSSNHYITNSFPAKSTIYYRLAVYLVTELRIWFREGTIVHNSLYIFPNSMTVYRLSTGTLAGTIYAPFRSTWQVIEGKTVIHDTAGQMIIKLNGVEVFNISGVDTRTGGTGVLDNLYLTHTGYIDDILVDDANWPGLGGIEVIRPNGAGTHQDWDDSDYTKVNADNDANYIATDAEVSERVSFTLPALAADRKTPKAVGLFTKSQLSGAGAGIIEPYFDNTPGSQLALSTSLQYTKDYQVAMPTEIGLKVIA